MQRAAQGVALFGYMILPMSLLDTRSTCYFSTSPVQEMKPVLSSTTV